MKLHKISIGLPVYNGEKYLTDAIESILSQTYEDIELIICDNASTDGTRDICEEFKKYDNRIKYNRNHNNIGAANNFNKVFHLSTGEYFKWSAHDDLCAPDFIHRCVGVLNENQDVVLCYPKAMIIDENGMPVGPYKKKLPTDSSDPAVRYEALIRFGHKCFEVFGLIRRNELRNTTLIGPYARGDGVLLVQLSLLGRFQEIPEYLFFPRQHREQSMSMVGDFRRYAVWFNPGLNEKMVFPYWRMHFEYLRAINMFELKWHDRIRCYRYLLYWLFRRLVLFRRDITFQIRRLLNR